MQVLSLVCLLALAGVSMSQNLEERVDQDIEKLWFVFPKTFFGLLTIFDFEEFFSKYDQDGDDDWSVDENEFAIGLGDELGLEDADARAYFKKFDFTRNEIQLFEEITTDDNVIAVNTLDFDGDGFVSEIEFRNGLSLYCSDLPWGVMFMQYRTNESDPTNYDDFVSSDLFGDGDWQRLFDDIDEDGDGFGVREEFKDFWVRNGYGIEETGYAWFDAFADGAEFIDRTIGWTTVFNTLDVFEDGALNYDEFINIDNIVRGPIKKNPNPK